jgi:succinate dehydrogenase / fumarate reductase cytochrome b subunit
VTTDIKQTYNNYKVFNFYNTAVGKKVVMAVSGVLLLGFVLAHLIGNLQIFLGADKFNAYAHFLKSIPGPLWLARIGLIVIFLMHVVTAFKLRIQNQNARTVSYKMMNGIQLSSASKYMLETGIVILLFVVLHLAHFTFGLIQNDHYHFTDTEGRHDVYRMVILGFQNGPYFLIYTISMLALGVHLRHAFWSIFQSIGLYSPALGVCLKKIALLLAILVSLAYISIPLSVKFGLLN